jgi:hypothetical protein
MKCRQNWCGLIVSKPEEWTIFEQNITWADKHMVKLANALAETLATDMDPWPGCLPRFWRTITIWSSHVVTGSVVRSATIGTNKGPMDHWPLYRVIYSHYQMMSAGLASAQAQLCGTAEQRIWRPQIRWTGSLSVKMFSLHFQRSLRLFGTLFYFTHSCA